MNSRCFIFLFALICASVVMFSAQVYASDDLVCSIEDSPDVCIIESDSEEFYTSSYVDDQLKINMEKSEDSVCIVYFYSSTCSHCAAIKPYLEQLEEKYGDEITVTRYSLDDPKNVDLYYQFCISKDYSGRTIPVIGVNDKILVGESQIREFLEPEIEKGISSENKICPLGSISCSSLNGKLSGTDPAFSSIKDLSWQKLVPVVLFAGLVDGINPCAFAVLIFMMAFLMQIAGHKRKLIKVSSAYLISVFAVNILLGVLYFYTSIKFGFPDVIRSVVIVVALIAGAINIKDFFFFGKGVSLKIPDSAHNFIQKFSKKASVFSAVVLGSGVAILEAPCSVPIYLTVIEILKAEGRALAQVFPYIMIYNLAFILPLLALAIFMYEGKEAKALESWRKAYRRHMRLMIGVILIGLAIAMIIGVL